MAECPDIGCGGDSLLNRRKNDESKPLESAIKTLSFTDFKKLKKHSSWKSNANRATLSSEGEGTPVKFTGYLIAVKHYTDSKHVESCNCKLVGEENNDFHLVLVPTKKTTEASSITAEMSPRSRPPGWTYKKLMALAKKKAQVEATGWLMFDTQHAGKPTPKRVTHWEIHPVTQFRVKIGTEWKNLEDIN